MTDAALEQAFATVDPGDEVHVACGVQSWSAPLDVVDVDRTQFEVPFGRDWLFATVTVETDSGTRYALCWEDGEHRFRYDPDGRDDSWGAVEQFDVLQDTLEPSTDPTPAVSEIAVMPSDDPRPCVRDFETQDESDSSESREYESNRCARCEQTFDNSFEYRIHRLERHGSNQHDIPWDQGEFPLVAKNADSVLDLAQHFNVQSERVMRALAIYGLSDWVAGNVYRQRDLSNPEHYDLEEDAVDHDVATDGGGR